MLPARAAAITGERVAAIESYVREEASAAHVESYAFAVVTRDDGVVLAKGVGADIGPDTPFQIGSLTKSITALATMSLVERGKLELDAPVQRYLPAFRVADADASSRITVRHLLNQTSGFTSSAGCYGADTRPAEERLRELRAVKVRPAGARFEYCNANYEVLALVDEAALGRSYGELVRESVFEPIGMKHAYADLDEATKNGLAWGHRDWFGLSMASRGAKPATIPSAGGILASAADMGRYLWMVLNGGTIEGRRVVSEATVEEMLRPPTGKRYGMGWRVLGVGDLDARIHDGATSVFTSSMMIAPKEGVGVVVLASANGFPLPFAELHAHDIAAGTLLMTAGRSARAATATSRYGLATMKWVVLAVALASLALFVARLRRRSTGTWSWPRFGIFTAIDLAIVYAMLVAMPKIPDLPFSTIAYCTPDLACAAIAASVLAGVRIALRFARRWSRATAIVAPEASGPAALRDAK